MDMFRYSMSHVIFISFTASITSTIVVISGIGETLCPVIVGNVSTASFSSLTYSYTHAFYCNIIIIKVYQQD